MTIHFKCDHPGCADANQEIRATKLVDSGIYTSASGRLWRIVERQFVDVPTAFGTTYLRRARIDTVIEPAAGGFENDFFASSEACADAIDAAYPEP